MKSILKFYCVFAIAFLFLCLCWEAQHFDPTGTDQEKESRIEMNLMVEELLHETPKMRKRIIMCSYFDAYGTVKGCEDKNIKPYKAKLAALQKGQTHE